MKRNLKIFIALALIGLLIMSSCTKDLKTETSISSPGPKPSPAPSQKNTGPALLTITPAPTSPLLSPEVKDIPPTLTAAGRTVTFLASGHTNYGDWSAETEISPISWQPGSTVSVKTNLKIDDSHLQSLINAGFVADSFCILVTAERTFDSNGWLRLASDERMSTLIAPTGLAIEGGVQGAVTNRFGAYDFRTPLDEFQTLPLSSVKKSENIWQLGFNINARLPSDLPPGIYRLRLDYGIAIKKRYLSLNAEQFAYRPFPKEPLCVSYQYSPPIPASGIHANGTTVEGSRIQPRIPWVLLGSYNSNGYSGVVADEDQSHFALSPRTLIPDDVILPLYAPDNKTRLAYSLEPQFPADTIDPASNIPWEYTRGELAVQIVEPDGKISDLGKAPFIRRAGLWLTTGNQAFTAWKPPSYGRYTVKASGWISDIWGNRYQGGGTYHFWIAKRMTLATGTFQGQAYPVGNRYGRDIGFSPAVPADVKVTATLFVNSDSKNIRTVAYSGKASPGGIYGAAQGALPLNFDAPGEYYAQVIATFTDQDGHFWVCSMRHAGVVYPTDSSIIAHGKKLTAANKNVDRGNTNFEGYIDSTGTSRLAHINFPYLAGDVLLIASDYTGSNKIEPVLTYESKNNPVAYDPKLQNIGITNIQFKTSNGYSPHLFPEYITDRCYYYAGAPRPGFMSRFIVAENGTRAPYWPTSFNASGQIDASNNGDLPGDIYRLLGGVVVRKINQPPVYAGYMASAFILPKGSNDNRVIAPGSEDLTGPDGSRARLFLVGTRPGMVYETGTAFTPVVQIDPILPANVTFTLIYPDGRKVTAQGVGDASGLFTGKDRWTLDIPGVYYYTLTADWQGYKGRMPGLSPTGGELYVIEKDLPANAPSIKLNMPEQSAFLPTGTYTINGTSSAQSVNFAAVIPGAVIDQGSIPVLKGKFSYTFDPAVIARNFPTYDILNLNTGKPEIKEVVQLTFFSIERSADGKVYHSFARIFFRGTTVYFAH